MSTYYRHRTSTERSWFNHQRRTLCLFIVRRRIPHRALAGSTLEQTAPLLPDQKTFQQYLRELARAALRVVLEGVMREELDALIGVGWGQSSPKRKGYRNGFYQRDLVTTSGRLEDLQVPRDREGQFHTQVFEQYRRYEPQVAQGLTEMFVTGTSTHKVGEVAKTLLGVAP